MRRTVLLAVLFLTSPAVAGTISQPILGGTQATEGQYPSVVAIDPLPMKCPSRTPTFASAVVAPLRYAPASVPVVPSGP